MHFSGMLPSERLACVICSAVVKLKLHLPTCLTELWILILSFGRVCVCVGGPLASVHRDIWGLSLFLLPTLISSWLPLRRICHCDPPTSSFPPPPLLSGKIVFLPESFLASRSPPGIVSGMFTCSVTDRAVPAFTFDFGFVETELTARPGKNRT